MEDAVNSQRAIIFFLWKEGVKASDIVLRLQAVFGAAAQSKSAVYRWIERFKDGKRSLKDESRSGRPSTSVTERNITAVEELLKNNERRLTIREMSASLGIGTRQVHEILHERLDVSKIPGPKPQISGERKRAMVVIPTKSKNKKIAIKTEKSTDSSSL